MKKIVLTLILFFSFSSALIFAHGQQEAENQLNLPENLHIEREILGAYTFYKVRIPHLAVVANPPMPDVPYHWVALREMRGEQ